MNDDTAYRIDLEALVSEREGMIAENKQREVLDQSMAYTADDFMVNANLMRELRR